MVQRFVRSKRSSGSVKRSGFQWGRWPDISGTATYPHTMDKDSFVVVEMSRGFLAWKAYARKHCCIAKGMCGTSKTDLENVKNHIDTDYRTAKLSRRWT